MADGMIYEVENLDFSYPTNRPGGDDGIRALRGVSISIEKGGSYCLCGPSGSGKTTLLNVLGLIEPVTGGHVKLDGRDLGALSERERNAIRRHRIGFVFQTFQLFQVLSALENVEFFLARQGIPAKERARKAAEALDAVGLSAERNRRPLEMSGGQRQRVAIARALAKRPEVVIADEPTASLDQETGASVMEILRRMSAERGITLLLSSHDPMVQAFAARRIELRDGRIV